MFFSDQRDFKEFNLLNDPRLTVRDADFAMAVRTADQYVGVDLVNFLWGK
jgi:hypothetical protein